MIRIQVKVTPELEEWFRLVTKPVSMYLDLDHNEICLHVDGGANPFEWPYWSDRLFERACRDAGPLSDRTLIQALM